jgi:hypothetical protein
MRDNQFLVGQPGRTEQPERLTKQLLATQFRPKRPARSLTCPNVPNLETPTKGLKGEGNLEARCPIGFPVIA